ncbi:MAG TPA: DUF1844 domain-containing protein [Capsulimonadaceae bacterium]|jgi:hypothetical protein
MTDTNNTHDEESFTFVDKRRVNTEAEAAPADEPAEPEAPIATDEAEVDSAADDFDPDKLPATYQLALYALGMLQMNAFQQLGLMADPKTGKSVRDLAQARVAIDCVASLAEVIDAPGSPIEARIKQEIRRVVTDLRLNFVTQTQLAGPEAK